MHLPERTPAPVIVCCHGLLSSKDGSKYVAAGETFSGGGFTVVRFDFSGCGGSKASPAGSLIESRVRDLEAVLDHVAGQSWSMEGKTGLFGSSMGGYVALLAAASGRVEVGAVACWATPFDLRKVERVLGSSDVLDRSEVSRRAFPEGSVLGHPRDLRSLPPVDRVLIIHGERDEIVPWREALDIYEQTGGSGRLLIMETADHRFLDSDCRSLALRVSLDWFRAHLHGEATTEAASPYISHERHEKAGG
jgi:alpha-beta hydrolase superfamily lysophospholipase